MRCDIPDDETLDGVYEEPRCGVSTRGGHLAGLRAVYAVGFRRGQRSIVPIAPPPPPPPELVGGGFPWAAIVGGAVGGAAFVLVMISHFGGA